MLHLIIVLMIVVAPIAMAQIPEGVEMEKDQNPVVSIKTPKGTMVLELFPDSAPKHVESFLNLIRGEFYEDLTFHRVVEDFVIQGGCPNGTGTGGPGYNLDAEFNERPHKKGTLAMARSQNPNSAGSQFYICLGRIPHLDGSYTVFGQLIKGHDVPEKVEQGDTMNISILQDQKK